MNNLLAFDCGATSGRAVLATFEDGAFRTEEVYRFPSEMVERGGRLCWDVRAIYRHFVACPDAGTYRRFWFAQIAFDGNIISGFSRRNVA